MPSKSKRWIFAILLATLFPALAIHVSCVAVLGPGSWGSGVEEKAPEILPAHRGAALHADDSTERETSSRDSLPELPAELDSRIEGRVFWVDNWPAENLWVVETHQGRRWIDRQQVYLWNGANQELEVLGIAEDMLVEEPTLVRRNGRIQLVFVRWRSWAIPPLEKLQRYVKSYWDPTLRPEFLLYVYDRDSGEREYFEPGHTFVAAPDHSKAAFLRSGALGQSFYSLHLWDFATDEVKTLLSLRGADESSGRSFDFSWSADSQALQLRGRTAGFQRRGGIPRELNLVYLLEEKTWYDLDISPPESES